jgi:hypothetical protein
MDPGFIGKNLSNFLIWSTALRDTKRIINIQQNVGIVLEAILWSDGSLRRQVQGSLARSITHVSHTVCQLSAEGSSSGFLPIEALFGRAVLKTC